MIKWANTNTSDLGLIVEHYPRVIIPNKRVEFEQIPGFNGDSVIDSECFDNYEQPYDIFLDAKRIGGLERIMPKVSDWLLTNHGYHRLEDSYFPETYRMACVVGGTEFVSLFNEYGEGKLKFNCAPERFFKSGDEKVVMENHQALYNPTSFVACPIITISGNGAGAITIDGNTVNITEIGGSVTLDVKWHKAYHDAENRASTISGYYEGLRLKKESEISWSGGVTDVELIPRWWTI